MKAGGYTVKTSGVNTDIYTAIRAQEVTLLATHRQEQVNYAPLRGFTFSSDIDCNVNINGGSDIFIPTGTGYSFEGDVISFIVQENLATINIAYNIVI